MTRVSLVRPMCSTSNLSKVAVIGLGNTLRRDDGIGIRILDLLRESIKDADISFLDFGIASFGLLSTLQEFGKVLLVDAIDAGLKPGTLKIFRFKEADCALRDKTVSTHELSLGDLINLYEALGLSTDVVVAGIQVKDVSYGEEMTEELESGKSRLAEQIRDFLVPWVRC
jgi:hydrogenase maturation protease